MISVFFVSTISAEQISMVTAVSLSINIGVIFAENLEIAYTLTDHTFHNIVWLKHQRKFSISVAIKFAFTA
jgi:hypothetical protein